MKRVLALGMVILVLALTVSNVLAAPVAGDISSGADQTVVTMDDNAPVTDIKATPILFLASVEVAP